MAKITDHIVFNDKKLEQKYSNALMPMARVYEAYFAGDLDIPGDIYAFLEDRRSFVKNTLTKEHFQWALTNFVPEALIHSKAQDKRIVREHYDRGDDFFGWFLGERMVYTCAFFEQPSESLEQAQDNKMNLVCRKLQLDKGERVLDIGCGWGTLIRHAARHYGVDGTGVTISKNQTAFGNRRIQDWSLGDRARIVCSDYREIPEQRFDKIVSLEMVEHVGVKNLLSFYKQVRDLLDDKGLFLLQWTGLRRGFRAEDLIWIMFMGKYIFPGADASLAPSPMLRAMEKAGWETHSVENVSTHYAWTIRRWHDNWLSNRSQVVSTYGERWFRIWHFFLAWSSIIARQGNAACFQVVLNKNLDSYDRTRWLARNATTPVDRQPELKVPDAGKGKHQLNLV